MFFVLVVVVAVCAAAVTAASAAVIAVVFQVCVCSVLCVFRSAFLRFVFLVFSPVFSRVVCYCGGVLWRT